VLQLAARCAQDGNLNAISDAISGAILAHAALRAAGYNVRVNLQSLDDNTAVDKMLRELSDLEGQAEQVAEGVQKTVTGRAKLG
jgi:formiminotetrahydrofolate cyclodeaminase